MRNRHTQPQLGRTHRRPAAPDARLASPHPRPGATRSAATGDGHRARRARAASRFTSYSEVLQRAAAADRRHVDGFQSQHRKPRPIAREPLPLPARRSRPPHSAPRGGASAPRHRGSPAGAERRGAEPTLGWDAIGARRRARASERRRGGRRSSHGGFPLMWPGSRRARAAEAEMRAGGPAGGPPRCALRVALKPASLLIG